MPDLTGSRKILVALVLLAVAVFVTYTKGDVPPGLLQMLSVLYGGFVLGNGIEHVARSVASRSQVVTTQEDETVEVAAPALPPAAAPEAVAPANPAPTGAAATVPAVDVQKSVVALTNRLATHEQALTTIQAGISHIITKAGLDK